MKRKHWILSALFIACAFVFLRTPIALTEPKQSTYEKRDNVRTVRVISTLKERELEKARRDLLATPGILGVQLNERTQEATVRIDLDKTDLKKLDEPLRKAGFIPWYH